MAVCLFLPRSYKHKLTKTWVVATWHKDYATAWWYEADITKSHRMLMWHHNGTDLVCCCCWMPLMLTSTQLLCYLVLLNSLSILQFSKCYTLLCTLFSVSCPPLHVCLSLVSLVVVISNAIHVEHCFWGTLPVSLVTSWLCDETRVWRVNLVTRWPCDELTDSLANPNPKWSIQFIPWCHKNAVSLIKYRHRDIHFVLAVVTHFNPIFFCSN